MRAGASNGPGYSTAIGDSITYGVGSSDEGGYRSRLFSLAQKDEHHISFVGSRESGPETVDGISFPRGHDGSIGYTLKGNENGDRGILPRINEQLSWHHPEIVILMAGTNDILQDIELDTASDRFSDILDEILSVAPDTHIFVLEVPPITRQETLQLKVETYNRSIEETVERHQNNFNI